MLKSLSFNTYQQPCRFHSCLTEASLLCWGLSQPGYSPSSLTVFQHQLPPAARVVCSLPLCAFLLLCLRALHSFPLAFPSPVCSPVQPSVLLSPACPRELDIPAPAMAHQSGFLRYVLSRFLLRRTHVRIWLNWFMSFLELI